MYEECISVRLKQRSSPSKALNVFTAHDLSELGTVHMVFIYFIYFISNACESYCAVPENCTRGIGNA